MNDLVQERFEAIPRAIGTITRLAFAHAKAIGCDATSLLRKAGLTAAQVNNPAARLSVRDQINFLNLVADAARDDLLGFHLAQTVELRELGLLYYVMASSESLGDAFRRCARYSSIVNEGISLECEVRECLRIALDYVGVSRHLDRHQIEFLAVIIVRVGRQLANGRLVPTRVRLKHRRDRVDPKLVQLFGKELEFGALSDEVNFAPSAAHLPVVSADSYLNKLLLEYCDEALASRPRSLNSFRKKVENAIVTLLPHGDAGAVEIANRLRLTKRSLARRLALEGLTFSEVLETLKCDLARRYLDDRSLSISHIAWLLGYQEASAFSHAFKRWTGKTPRQVRFRDRAAK